jgi:uncharacterized delta-60 repeat protein
MRSTRGLVSRRGRVRVTAIMALVALLLSMPVPMRVLANDGDLDLSFNSTGKVITNISSSSDEAWETVVQSDGKIVAVGEGRGPSGAPDFTLVRYNADGTLDTGFGPDGTGKVQTDFNNDLNQDRAFAAVLQSDGKIVAVGAATTMAYGIALARYNADGTLDTSFGPDGTGKVASGLGGTVAYGAALQGDGKILVAGETNGASDFIVGRYNTDGTPDTGFGSSGWVVTDFGSSSSGEHAYDVEVQSDGKVVAVGSTNGDGAVARYNADGTPDTSFGPAGTGRVVTNTANGAGADVLEGVAFQNDGKLLAYGNGGVVRYDIDGTLDPSFGSAATGIAHTLLYVRGLTLQSDGRIVGAGHHTLSNADFGVTRLNTDGTIDTAFGSNGYTYVDFGNTSDFAYATALQSDGRIVVAGSSLRNGSDDYDFALARFGTVPALPTTTVLSASSSASLNGEPVTLTAAVSASSGTPEGTVEFFDGSASLGTAAVSFGQAVLSTSSIAVGNRTLTATFTPSTSTFLSSTSPGLAHTVSSQFYTTTSLVSSVNPSVSGQSVTFTATVTAPAGGTPSGTVRFLDGTTTLANVTLSSGQATLTRSNLSVATHPITARYLGNSTYVTSTSPVVDQVVNKIETTTTLVSSANPAPFGQPVTFTATVAAVAPGTGTPNGNVRFYDGATLLATVGLAGGTAQLTRSNLGAGSHDISALYVGTAVYATSTSATVTQQIDMPATTLTLISSNNPSLAGQKVAFTAVLNVAGPGGPPTGTITFYDNGVELSTKSVTNGIAQHVTTTLSAGTHSITAVYSGSANHQASNSNEVVQNIN